MTVAVAPVVGEVILSEADAREITSRIRRWVKTYPLEDIKRAYFGQVWLAMGYESWGEWCDHELDGFKLPAVERREVVAELAGSRMSNRAIADVTGVTEGQVRHDKKQVRNDYAPDRPVLGQDGKTYRKPAPKPKPSADTTEIIDAEIVEPEPPQPTTPKPEPDERTPRDDVEIVNALAKMFRPDQIKIYSPWAKQNFTRILKSALKELEKYK